MDATQREMTHRADRTRRLVLSTALLLIAFTVLAVVIASRWAPVMGFDDDTDIAAHTLVLNHPALVSAAVVATNAGSPLSIDILVGVAALGLLLTRRILVAAYLVLALVVDYGAETVVKHLLARPRPVWAHPLGHAAGFGFPSGHAGGTALLCASALILAAPRLAPRPRLYAVTLASLAIIAVSTSRVLLGVHYPSDVLGGTLLGIACALGTAPILQVAHRHSHAGNGIDRAKRDPRTGDQAR